MKMINITVTSVQHLIDAQKRIAEQQIVLQERANADFIKDFIVSNQGIRMLDNIVIMLKHKNIPDAIKAGKSEVDVTPTVTSFLAPWITGDVAFKELSIEGFGRMLTTAFAGYTVSRNVGTDGFKISWAS